VFAIRAHATIVGDAIAVVIDPLPVTDLLFGGWAFACRPFPVSAGLLALGADPASSDAGLSSAVDAIAVIVGVVIHPVTVFVVAAIAHLRGRLDCAVAHA
jgi:hypothetical protein